MGIGEVTPLVTSFDFFDFVSLHSLSYLWVSGRRHCCYWGRRRSQRLMLASPSAPFLATPRAFHAGITLDVIFTLVLTLTSALADA